MWQNIAISLAICFLNKSTWAHLLKMLASQCGKGLLYLMIHIRSEDVLYLQWTCIWYCITHIYYIIEIYHALTSDHILETTWCILLMSFFPFSVSTVKQEMFHLPPLGSLGLVSQQRILPKVVSHFKHRLPKGSLPWNLMKLHTTSIQHLCNNPGLLLLHDQHFCFPFFNHKEFMSLVTLLDDHLILV